MSKWDLRVWSRPDDVFPGERRAQAAIDHISRSFAVIVLLPTVADADDVERDTLEGLRQNRHFWPILLSNNPNNRLVYHLGLFEFFDSRDGRLPGDAQLRQLRSMADEAEDSRTGRSRSWTPAAGARPDQRLTLPVIVNRPSTEEWLGKLRAYLSNGQLEYADITTTSILLSAAGRFEKGSMTSSDADLIKPHVLDAIDDAWSAFSSGEFGFRAQLRRHRAPAPGFPPGSPRDEAALIAALGWENGRRSATPKYHEFVLREHPTGFFPTFRNPQDERFHAWANRWRSSVMAIHLRLRKWE